jgi:hypothetical protein
MVVNRAIPMATSLGSTTDILYNIYIYCQYFTISPYFIYTFRRFKYES